MKDLFITKSFNFISSHKQLDHYNEIKIKYGLEVMYHFITKVTAIMAISFFLKILKENFLIFIFYFFLRKNSHGLHAKSNIGCWITSITVYVFVGCIAKYCSFNLSIMILINIICFLSFALWAPADTKSRPLIRKKDRITLKIKTLINATCELVIFGFFKNLRVIITLVFILQSIVINPIVYKITGSTFNNYRNVNS